MELPWKKAERLEQEKEELETQIQDSKEEIKKLENMLESEKDRRSKLSREKQEAEKKVNQLQDKLETLQTQENKASNEESSENLFTDISFENSRSALEKLKQIESPDEDLITVYSPGKLSEHSQLTDIRNSIPEDVLKPLNQKKGLIIFYSEDLGVFCFKITSFYSEKFDLKERFVVRPLIDFLEAEKVFAFVSRGDTRIMREKRGNLELVEHVKDRVNRKHGKGGFSQGRFERKRDEQIQSHIENVESELQKLENVYLLGDEALCSELSGEHLGGFDPNSSDLENIYGLGRLKTSIQ